MRYMCVPVDRCILRAYDIRGLVKKQLTPSVMYTIGRAVALMLQDLNRNTVFLGRDARHSSADLALALKTGLCDGGCDVFDVGEVTTPMLYFATQEGKTDSGLMVTGSHNPADYNGLKLLLAGQSCITAQIEALYEKILFLQTTLLKKKKGLTINSEILKNNRDFRTYKKRQGRGALCASSVVYTPLNEQRSTQCNDEVDVFRKSSKKGISKYVSVDPAYIKRVTEDIHLQRSFKVVVDAGHGIAGPISIHMLQKLGCEVIPLYCEVDGSFPHHHPDPSIEANLMDLKQTVIETKADLGLGFDGDGDRLGVVTNEGEIIWPDRIMMFYLSDILKRYPQATIVFDVKCSKTMQEYIELLGGKACMCPTGHALVKHKMQEVNAPLAGEMSGHLFFQDRWYGFDDALYSACRLLELLSYHPESIHQQFLKIPKKISTPELKIPIEDHQKFEFMQRFIEATYFQDAVHITIDGLRIEFTHGWGLLRASNTMPCLVARFEADSETALLEIQALFKTALLTLSQGLKLPF